MSNIKKRILDDLENQIVKKRASMKKMRIKNCKNSITSTRIFVTV